MDATGNVSGIGENLKRNGPALVQKILALAANLPNNTNAAVTDYFIQTAEDRAVAHGRRLTATASSLQFGAKEGDSYESEQPLQEEKDHSRFNELVDELNALLDGRAL